jgi:hypothetical protein
MKHYVASEGIVAQAIDRLEQPDAFTAGLPPVLQVRSAAAPAAASLEEARAMLARGRQMQEEAARLIERLGWPPAELPAGPGADAAPDFSPTDAPAGAGLDEERRDGQ